MRWKTLFILAVVVLIYIGAGAFVFYVIEEDNAEVIDKSYHQNMDHFTSLFLENNPSVNRTELESLLKLVLQGHGLNRTTEEHGVYWNVYSSLLLATTVVTTIGYGHLSPKTDGGQTFFIFYAMWGIPLFMVMLAMCGKKINCTIQHTCIEKFHVGKKYCKLFRCLKILSLLLVGNILFIIIPAFTCSIVEGWTFQEAVYFVFTSLTTVGFGDFVAGINPNIAYPWWYLTIRPLYMLIGLIWLSTTVGAKAELMQRVFEKGNLSEITKNDQCQESSEDVNKDNSQLHSALLKDSERNIGQNSRTVKEQSETVMSFGRVGTELGISNKYTAM